MNKFQKRPQIQWETQLQLMLTRYPNSTGRITSHSELVWKANLKPSALSDIYWVDVSGKPFAFPNVWVSGRGIDGCKDLSAVPHKFDYGENPKRIKICLEKGDWKPSLSLADTLLPWTMEWLVQYEIWLCTETWNGEGVHPRKHNQNMHRLGRRAASMKPCSIK